MLQSGDGQLYCTYCDCDRCCEKQQWCDHESRSSWSTVVRANTGAATHTTTTSDIFCSQHYQKHDQKFKMDETVEWHSTYILRQLGHLADALCKMLNWNTSKYTCLSIVLPTRYLKTDFHGVLYTPCEVFKRYQDSTILWSGSHSHTAQFIVL